MAHTVAVPFLQIGLKVRLVHSVHGRDPETGSTAQGNPDPPALPAPMLQEVDSPRGPRTFDESCDFPGCSGGGELVYAGSIDEGGASPVSAEPGTVSGAPHLCSK